MLGSLRALQTLVGVTVDRPVNLLGFPGHVPVWLDQMRGDGQLVLLVRTAMRQRAREVREAAMMVTGCGIKAGECDGKDVGQQGPMNGDGRSGTQAPALKPVPY